MVRYPTTNSQSSLTGLGEFGPIYERKEYNPDWEVQNEERYNMLDRQMAIYTSESIGKPPAIDSYGH